MGTYKAGGAMAGILFRRWRHDKRIHCVLLFIGMLLARELWGISRYGMETGGECTVFVFSILFPRPNNVISSMKLILHVAMLVLLCDVPFVNRYTPYMVLRGRRKAWWFGCCLYIMGTALFFTLFIVVISIVTVIPVISFSREWGSVLTEFAIGTKDPQKQALRSLYQMLRVSNITVNYLYADAVWIYTIVTVWADFTVLGLLMYLVSMIRHNILLSIGTAGFLVFLDPLCFWLSPSFDKWYWLASPVTWCSVDATDIVPDLGGGEKILSMEYVCIAYPVLIMILLAATAWRSRRWTIETI